MKKEYAIAVVSNSLSWSLNFLIPYAGAVASIATALYFTTKWLFLLWDRYKGKPPAKEE